MPYKVINAASIGNVLGILLILVGGLMFTTVLFSVYYGSSDMGALVGSSFVTLAVGTLLFGLTRSLRGINIRKREGYLIVTLGWVVMTIFGALPYYLSGITPSITDAFFETMSGLTTTGATIFTEIEGLPQGILFWRSLTQWIGGMGIIVLTVALLPLLGIGGIELFVAEAPGPTSEKIHPRIQGTAKRLWLIYVSLTGLLTAILWLQGMTFFDAINHGLTTMATGGFSTKNASMAAFPPLMQYTVAVFMLIAGTNYTVLYWSFKRRWSKVLLVEEFRAYLTVILLVTSLVTFALWAFHDLPLEQAFRDSFFQIVSLVTTTGYATADYTQWSTGLTLLFFVLIFLGGCAGSTSGGIKFVRHLVFFKNSFLEFKRVLHPRAIVPLKINGSTVSGRIITHVIIFLLLYLSLFIFGSLLLSFNGLDFETAIGATATCISNVGPGIGSVGPVDNFAHLPVFSKWVLSFLMLAGRLEIFTVLVLFTPYFWKPN